MLNRQLIFLATPRQIGVLDWRPGHLRWLGHHTANSAGFAAFSQLVARHAHLPATVVVDSVDEDYRSESLPHVQGPPRTALVARKLRQAFRNAQFAGAWRQTRDTAGRRDDHYLFAALTDNDWLTPWLNILHHEGVPLKGVTPMAMACQHLLGRLRGPEPHVLMACRLHNSLRLSYYQNGMLRFSRLIGGETPTQLPGGTADEIAKTQLYLIGQRILPRDARLHVLLLDPTTQLDSAFAALNADPAFSVRRVDATELARALRIPDDFLRATPEVIPLAAIAGKRLLLNLAPATALRRYTDYLWQHTLQTIAGSLAFAGVVVTAALWLHAESLDEDTHQLGLQTRQINTHYEAIARTFPRQDVAPERLAQTVAIARTLESPGPDPQRLMTAVSAGLNATPDVVLQQLAWTADEPATANEAADIRLEAGLSPFDGNYRAAMQHIEGFMQILGRASALHDVRLRTSPVNTDPGSSLSGKTQNTDSALPQMARFSVDMRYREANP